ncbi:MAG: ABC transporter ATP-binding protein/permease [Lentisphaerae bacterium]|nr:ABC transporter ATP-binding protein/permease [Lentisphaerota bacterium]
MDVLRRLLPFLKPHRRWILAGSLCLLLATPCQLFHPLVWKFVVDTVILAGHHHWLLPAMAVMLAVHLTGTALGAARSYLLGVAGQNFIFDLRNHIYRKLQGQSLTYFHNHRSGDLISRTMSDVDALQDLVIEGIDNVLGSALSFLFVAGVIIYLQWVVGVITLVPLSVVAVLIFKFNIRLKRLYRGIRDRLADVTAKLHENLAGMMIIKAFARDQLEIEKFRAENQTYRMASLQGVRARAFYFPGIMSLGFLSNVIMIGLGGLFVIRGTFTLGGLVAYRGYWWQLFAPIQTLARVNDLYQRAMAAAGRIFELLDTPEQVPDKPGALVLAAAQGRLEFRQVDFAYDGRQPVLQGVSLAIQPGETIGICGPSGSGKSTLLNLILRFYDPSAGAIFIDGHDLRDLQQESLRRHIGVVTQEPFLFHLTVAENLRYGNPDAAEADLWQALERANAHDFVAALPDRLDTVLGERGIKLSGGQRQRLCIARAFLENPRVLLLDEATAAVEPESEALIQSALQRLMQGRTTVIVSHRLSMVRGADRILVIEGGQIRESGTHEGLMRQDSWYARMYRLQTQDAPLVEPPPA